MLHGDREALESSGEAYKGGRNKVEDDGEAQKNVTKRR